MLSNMVTSLLDHEAIRTTVPKAKEARKMAERIITLGKRGGLSNMRLAARTVRNKAILGKVFGDLKSRYATRPGGYTRIVRLGFRNGDAAEMALLELIDRPERGETAPEGEKAPKAKAEAKPEAKTEAKAEKPKSRAKPKAKAEDDKK
jgi:large subunit ribosomal protein L17